MNHINPPNLPCPAKSVLKLALALPGSALTNFPCKLRLNFFSSLDVQMHPLHPLLYAYGNKKLRYLEEHSASVVLSWCTRVRRRSRRTFSTHFENFRRRFDGVVIYLFFLFRLQIFRRRVGIFSYFFICCFFSLQKVHVSFSLSQVSIGTRAIGRSSTVLLLLLLNLNVMTTL